MYNLQTRALFPFRSLKTVCCSIVSVTLWFRRLQCLLLRSVLSVFINLRSAECVCSYYGLRVCYKQKKKKIVHSQVRYAITSWGSSCFSTLNTLNIIHYKLLRILTFIKFNSDVCKLYRDTKILNIDRIFKLEISKVMYKIKFRLVPKQFTELFTKLKTFNRIIQDNKYWICHSSD